MKAEKHFGRRHDGIIGAFEAPTWLPHPEARCGKTAIHPKNFRITGDYFEFIVLQNLLIL
jgi:hypothetical protein